MSPSLLLYDIPSSLPTQAWSPNVWKTRYALNYKGIPYETVWLEYPEIEPRSKELGAGPTRKKLDGSPNYTFPMIHDRSTGTVLAESTHIAAYLEATYPDTPRLIPPGTAGLLRAFEDAILPPLNAALYPYTIPGTHRILNPPSQAFLRRKREAWYGKAMEDITPRGEEDEIEWNKVKAVFGKVDEWSRLNGQGSEYIMGDEICYADMWLAGYVTWIKLVLPDRWEEMKLWHGGRWATLMRNLEKYATIV